MFKRFGLGFGVGYVLGARAGQKRYEELTGLAQRVVDLPLVQQASEQARNRVTQDRARHLLDQVRSRAGHAAAGADEGERPGRDSEPGGPADEVRDQTGYDDDRADEDYDDDYDDGGADEGYDDGGADEGYDDDGGGRAEADEGGRGRAGSEPRGAGDRMKAAASAALERGRVG